jgi:hypothetical protein
MRGDKMDEMLSMSLWIMIAFMMVSASVMWFNSQTDISYFNLGIKDYSGDSGQLDANKYTVTACEMTSLFDAPQYAVCFLNKITAPVVDVVSAIWNLLTNWQILLHNIFAAVPAGDLFESILLPFFTIIEIGAAIVILMRLAAIVRGSGAIGI